MAEKNKSMKKKQPENLKETIAIPAGIDFTISPGLLTASKSGKSILRKFPGHVKIEKKGDSLEISIERARKAERRLIMTIAGHIKNMIEGLEKGFEYELEICNVHFPITVTFDKAKKEFLIKNVLGEKTPRISHVFGDVEVEIKAPKIKLKSSDIEMGGQTAANLEKATKIRNRDRNKFQDGIFITKKPGVEFI
jgi:large subunit ribosomal protein L6